MHTHTWTHNQLNWEAWKTKVKILWGRAQVLSNELHTVPVHWNWNFKLIRKLGLDNHCPWMKMVSQLHQLLQHHPGGDGVVACVQAYEVVQDIQTCFVCVAPAFWTDHKALGQSRRSRDSRQNQNHSVCLDLVPAAYPVDHRHMDPSHKASNALSPVNTEYLISSCSITSKPTLKIPQTLPYIWI